MIEKIISGGQTGVDRAALDAAIRLGIPHGGWIPKGRLTEEGPLPETYALTETASAVYAERTEKNVIDADGTLIISRGELCGGSAYTREMAVKHGRPFLHVDLDRESAFKSALTIRDWIAANRITVLNVAGPRASKDPCIYRSALALMEAVCYMSLLPLASLKKSSSVSDTATPAVAALPAPLDVQGAVQQIVHALPLKDRVTIANMSPTELPSLLPTLGEHIIRRYLSGSNPTLLNACRWVARQAITTDTEAARVIIQQVWKTLKRTHALRSVK